jgi:hypothetical protein
LAEADELPFAQIPSRVFSQVALSGCKLYKSAIDV